MMEERRREPRRPADGLIKLTLPDGTVINATLLDQSASGFRARYPSAGVRSGTEVIVDLGAQNFRARVAWTVTVEGQNQSGFFKS